VKISHLASGLYAASAIIGKPNLHLYSFKTRNIHYTYAKYCRSMWYIHRHSRMKARQHVILSWTSIFGFSVKLATQIHNLLSATNHNNFVQRHNLSRCKRTPIKCHVLTGYYYCMTCFVLLSLTTLSAVLWPLIISFQSRVTTEPFPRLFIACIIMPRYARYNTAYSRRWWKVYI